MREPDGAATARPFVHHIPLCPFSQRIEILLALKGRPEAARFAVVDVTRPRDARLLELGRGSTVPPILETGRGVLRESLVILAVSRRASGAGAACDPLEIRPGAR